MKAHEGFHSRFAAMMLVLLAVALLAGSAVAEETHAFANGLTAVVYSPQEIAENPALCGIELSSENRQAFAFDQNMVTKALADMQGFQTDLTVDVFLLPALPAQVSSSYASKNRLYLAPGNGPVAESTVAYITTHEMGHVLTWAFLDGDSRRWDSYLELRGLDSVDNGPMAAHADRAREILAEDFRYLFGGHLSTVSGSIENHDLALPTHVFGLKDLLVEFVAGRAPEASLTGSRAFPNPCNPRTTVSMSLNPGAAVDLSGAVLRVFDIRGALVRTLHSADLVEDQIHITWNGDNDAGSAVASGRYLYLMQAGTLQARGSVTLVR
jgi:hypothetical protein|nr:FlgD immunoglobulin-like domain containing protein [Candidatus Krumholzibacteria bacterium]